MERVEVGGVLHAELGHQGVEEFIADTQDVQGGEIAVDLSHSFGRAGVAQAVEDRALFAGDVGAPADRAAAGGTDRGRDDRDALRALGRHLHHAGDDVTRLD